MLNYEYYSYNSQYQKPQTYEFSVTVNVVILKSVFPFPLPSSLLNIFLMLTLAIGAYT